MERREYGCSGAAIDFFMILGCHQSSTPEGSLLPKRGITQ